MARTTWQELSPRTRRLIIISGAVDGTLKVAALVDLARRPAADINGSKAAWAVALTLVNSAGALPVAYFAYGRRRL